MPAGAHPIPSQLSREVGGLLSDALAARGLSRTEVAAHAQMSLAQLSRTLSGKKVFTLDQLDAVCAVIGIDLVDLLTLADRNTRSRPLPGRATGIITEGRFGQPRFSEPTVRGPLHDERAVAKKRSRDRGGDDGQG